MLASIAISLLQGLLVEAARGSRRRQLLSVSFTSTDRGFTHKFTDTFIDFYKSIQEAYNARPVDKPELPIKDNRTVHLLVNLFYLLVIDSASRSISHALAESFVKPAGKCPASHARMQVTLLGASVLKIKRAARILSSSRIAITMMTARSRLRLVGNIRGWNTK